MGKLKSSEEISRRFNPVTEGDFDSSGLDSDSTESVSSKIDFGVSHLDAAISSADYCALELLKPSPASAPEPELPGNLEELIGRRAEAEARFAADQQPEPGKIIALQLDSPGTETAVAQEPVAVLLDVMESDNRTWHGWVVSRDRAYATNWDLILGPEEGDLDPLCEIVQTWNPVRVVLPARIRVLGQLSPYRLAAARTLAVDGENSFISGPPGEHRIGVALARELSDGTGVVTGSSIANPDDPRTEYQRIYREIADKLAAPALAVPAPKPQPASPSFLQRLFGLPAWQLGGALATLLLVPLVVMLVMKSQPEQSEIAVAPPALPQGVHRYAGTGETQQLRVADPEAKAQEIVEALRQIGALPDTRSSWADMVSIHADLSRISVAEQSKVLSKFELAVPQDGMLKVEVLRSDIQQGQKNSSPQSKEEKAK
jgi:hypothetical protein